MTNNQGTKILIEKDSMAEADFMSRNFINKALKNRAYVNTLASELFIKYLKTEGFDTDGMFNLHSISRVLEKFDISDIRLKNIHIDVRAVFNKEQIFIPKSHFEYNLVPDIYVVLVLNSNFTEGEIAGYFTPDLIDKKNSNSEYYFLDPQKLLTSDGLCKFIKDFKGEKPVELSEEEFLRGRELSVKLADHQTSTDEDKELIKLLSACLSLRESVIEFDNFETLAYNTIKEIGILDIADDISESAAQDLEILEEQTVTPTAFGEDFDNEFSEFDFDSDETPNLNTSTDGENENGSAEEEQPEEKAVEEDEAASASASEEAVSVEDTIPSNENPFEKIAELTASAGLIKTYVEKNMPEKAVDFITDEAIRLAGLAGDVVGDLIENQAKPLEFLDYTKSIENYTEIPEEVSNLKPVKTSSDTEEGENSFAQVMDLEDFSNAKQETPAEVEEVFTPETIDMTEMETVETTDVLPNIEDEEKHLAALDFNSAEFETAEAPEINLEEQAVETMDLPDLSLVDADDNNQASGILEEPEPQFDCSLMMDLPGVETLDLEDATINEGDGVNETFTCSIQELQDKGFSSNEPDFSAQADVQDEILQNDMTLPEETIIEEPAVETQEEPLDLQEVEDFSAVSNAEFLDELTAAAAPEEISEPELFDELPEENLTEETSETDDLSEFFTEDEPQTSQGSDEVSLDDIMDEFEPASDETDDISEIQESAGADLEDDTANIENSELFSNSELDEEFTTDLNTEIETDETMQDYNPASVTEADISDQTAEVQDEKPAVITNSTVISDKNFTPGEIPIDINTQNYNLEGSENLESLYNDEKIPGQDFLQTPGTVSKVSNAQSGKFGFVKAVLALAIVGVIGFGAAKFFKAPSDETPQPTTDDALPTDTLNSAEFGEKPLDVKSENVVNMEKNNNTLAGTNSNTNTPNIKPQAPAVSPAGKSPQVAGAYPQIQKLTWEVPDYISYQQQFKQYFQSAGKSLKLSLTSDLLLATDFTYSKEVKISTTFNKDGSFKDARIVKSSGSSQIDNIMLRTVNQTLKVLKAPSSVGNDESTTAILKIYF